MSKNKNLCKEQTLETEKKKADKKQALSKDLTIEDQIDLFAEFVIDHLLNNQDEKEPK